MKKNAIITFLKGLFIGGTMTVPGISGGSMAMILGIYDRMISSVSGVLRLEKKSFIFLAECVIGAVLGMVLFSNSILSLIERFPLPMSYFFIGAVVGGAPMIYRSAKVTRFTPGAVIYPIIGIILVLLIALLPEGIFAPGESFGVSEFFLQLLGGVIVAIALVLPGISVSQMLLMLGLYEPVMKSIGSLNILPIIPLGIGVLLGTVMTAKLMDKAMHRFPQATYLIILGFVLGSVRELFPGLPMGLNIPICIVTAAAGFFVVYVISSKTSESTD